MKNCQHHEFDARVEVTRLSKTEDGPAEGFSAEVRIRCRQCEAPFEFLGLEPGLDLQGARVSLDGQQLRVAIVPHGMRPSPLQRMVGNIGKYDA